MSMKKSFGLMAMAAALMADMSSPLDNNSKLSLDDIDFKPKEPPVPNGCKRHYFDKYGECPKGNHLVYFDAMRKKSAIIKWERWLNTHSVSGGF